MYCNKCGSIVPDNATRCTVCGAAAQPKEGVGFVDAMKLYFARFADFSGRSRRSEYWWATLGVMIISSLVTTILPDLAWIWSLVTLVPSMAMCVRRLHDVGLSGFWLLYFLPLGLGLAAVYLAYLLDLDPSCNKIIENNKKVGSHWLGWILTVLLWSTGCSLILFIITLTPGQKEENAYGLNPCYDFD